MWLSESTHKSNHAIGRGENRHLTFPEIVVFKFDQRNGMKIVSLLLISVIFVMSGCIPSNIYLKDGDLSNTYFEKDRWDSDRINIKSDYGVTEGYIKPDRWESDRLNIYDQLGRPTGTYLKKDRWRPDRWNIKQGP